MSGRAGRRVELPDGRYLGIVELGDRQGQPVFYCHGYPGSRLDLVPCDEALAASHIRLIGVDRPGIGLSSPSRRPTLGQWADDIGQLADAMGLVRFGVLGYSAGGPYAASCAARLGDRIRVLGLLAPLTPADSGLWADLQASDRILLRLAGSSPALARGWTASLWLALRLLPSQVLVSLLLRESGSESDRDTIRRSPELASALLESGREGLSGRGAGAADDLHVLATATDLSLSEISVPTLIWHGDEDVDVPIIMAEYYRNAIAGASLVTYRHSGHLVAFQHADSIARLLASNL